MEELVHKVLSDQYGLHQVHLTKMEGYDSTNFKVTGESFKYVLKVYDTKIFSLARVAAENHVLSSLQNEKGIYPKPIANQNGEEIYYDETQGKGFRLLTFLEGTFWGEAEIGDQQIKSFGTFLANLDRELITLRQPIIESTYTIWDLEHFLDNQKYLHYIDAPEKRKLAAYFLLQYKTFIIERLPLLRRTIIHNDGNEWNVLLQNGSVSGMIDFGDMVYSRLIFEIAIAGAYICLGQEDPVHVISTLLSSYNEIIPLHNEEVDLLYYLIAARLCTSVINSAKKKLDKPDSAYITVSEQGAWDLLERWVAINPQHARKIWREAIDHPLEEINKDLMNQRSNSIPTVLSVSYQRPIHMTGAAFQYMYDADGNGILDAYNNIIQVGHCHPHVVSAGQKSMATLNTNTRYLYESLTSYSEKLLDYFPEHLNKVFFVNSGSAASDLAVRLAKTHTGRQNMVVIEHGYHGNTNIGVNISHYKYSNEGGKGKQSDVIQGTLPDSYRGRYRGKDAGPKYAQDLIEKLDHSDTTDIAAFIAEPIVGCGGQVPIATGYLPKVYDFMKSKGILCISDEVQVGFGRLGKVFWGYELFGVSPDIVILGKPIGNGHPMAAIVTTSEIANSFDNGMEFFSSFGGNPVSCAIGEAVLEVIEEENLQNNALNIGTYLKKELSLLSEKHLCMGDVRGEGLFLGIDIVKDNDSRDPDGSTAKYIVNFLRLNSILTSLDGPAHNVIKIKPPLCFTKDNAKHLISMIDKALEKKDFGHAEQ